METNSPILGGGEGKTVAILSYITIIGWLIAYFGFHQGKKTSLGSYHLRQALFMFLCFFVLYVVLQVLLSITGAMVFVYLIDIANILYLILAIVGIINAANSVEKPLPLIGQRAESYFPSI